jgi:hypothetical protein
MNFWVSSQKESKRRLDQKNFKKKKKEEEDEEDEKAERIGRRVGWVKTEKW